VVNVDDSARAAYIAHAYTQAGAHMLIHDVCSTNRNRASNASEARLHTQSQGSYASTEGYDRSRGDNTAEGQHTLVCPHVYVEGSRSDSRELGVSVRHEGQDSTCREAGAILLSLMSTVVVSDCSSLYLSTRAIFILMGQPLLFEAVSGPGR
jgi:hypothetical protein